MRNLWVLLLLVGTSADAQVSPGDISALCRVTSADKVALARKLQGHLESEAGERLLRAVMQTSEPSDSDMLREEARRANVAACPLADALTRASGRDPTTGCLGQQERCFPPAIDERFARAFAKLPGHEKKIVSITLAAGERVPDLSRCPLVLHLAVGMKDADHKAPLDLAPLASASFLKTLVVFNGTLEHVGALKRLKELTSLRFRQVYLAEPLDLGFLGEMKRLQSLELSAYGTPNAVSVEPLAKLHALTELNLVGIRVDDYRPFSALKGLKDLKLPARESGERALPLFGKDAKLVSYQEEGGDLSFLEPLAALEKLEVHGMGATDLRPLAALKNLRELSLAMNGKLSSLQGLEALSRLETLSVSDSPLRDLKPLHRLRSLRRLELADVPSLNLEPLAGLPRLETVGFQSMAVKSLTPLLQVPSLRYADLPASASAEEIRALREALPGLSLTCTGRHGMEDCPGG